jgi:hypothetical protein
VWSHEKYTFRITGQEFSGEIPPTPEALLKEVKKRSDGPIVTCTKEEIGHLLPTQTWPELTAQIEKDAKKALVTANKPIAIHIDDKSYPSTMKAPTPLFFEEELRRQLTVEGRMQLSLFRNYLLTGNSEYKEAGIRRLLAYEKFADTAHWTILGKDMDLKRHGGGKSGVNESALLLVDAFYNDLPKELQKKNVEAVLAGIQSTNGDGPELHEALEHQLYDQHAWQGRVGGLLIGSMVLCRYEPRFEDWLKYAYELFLYRCPAFSRTDGGSSEGNGYFGVHEEMLTHIPWVLYKLTGHNFYGDKRWFQNFSRYMTYSNPKGNPGISFEDSGSDDGSDLQYLSEFLARMCPENTTNLWQAQSVGRRTANYFSADINKGTKAWDLMSLWQRFPTMDLSKAAPPVEKAAAFRDIGLTCMHTDLANAADNLMVNFRAGPYGSESHTHPAENAFTVAYGGQPLFWRTGYYNGGGMHNIYSYKSSRAHNTIMADGLVQGFDEGAYGWTARFATGDRISYALGDASHAYNGKHHYFNIPYVPDLKGVNKAEERRNWEGATAVNGFGNPEVTRFRRHMVLLRPNHVLIYDELETKKPIPWTFQLHSPLEMKQLSDSRFVTANEHAMGCATLFCAAPVQGALTDKFKAEAVDEENKRKGQNPPNWHATITTRGALAATRFLTVIEVSPQKGLDAGPTELMAKGTGRTQIQAGDYVVTVELDPNKPSFLEVHDTASSCALVTGQAARQITVGNQQRAAQFPGSTLLWETKAPHGELFLEKVDELPDCLKFGNRY